MLDDKKIAFIICANNDLYYNECVWYINQLIVPEGYETDTICITGAESMAEAYNAAMNSSDAKYKVYLHQDVFIYHRGFIEDIIKVFESDKELGLLGVLGGVKLPRNAIIWNAWNQGATYASDYNSAFSLVYYQEPDSAWMETEAVDGMLMITQYDIQWREDLDLGWDFYDISQSLEFRRNGYKVGIPSQSTPWCMHDCGHSKLIRYDEARAKILEEYQDFFGEEHKPGYIGELFELEEQLASQIISWIEAGRLEQASQIKEMYSNRRLRSNRLQLAVNLMDVYAAEKNGKVSCSFFDNCSWGALLDKYTTIKFLTRHMENDTNPEAVENFLEAIKCGTISKEAVWVIAQQGAVNRDKVFKMLCGIK